MTVRRDWVAELPVTAVPLMAVFHNPHSSRRYEQY